MESVGLRIQRVLMGPEHVRRLRSQGTVDEDRDRRDSLGVGESVQQQDQLLRAAESKGGDDNFPSPFGRAHHRVREFIANVIELFMQADLRTCFP